MRCGRASLIAPIALTFVASVASAQDGCEGDECVLQVPEQPPFETPISELAPPPTDAGIAEWSRTPRGLLAAVVDPRLREVRRVDDGLLGVGLAVFGVGYLAGILVGILDQTAWNCHARTCDTWPLSAIPFAGGVLAGTVEYEGTFRTNEGWGWGLGLPALALQMVGSIVVTMGTLRVTEEVVGASEVRLTISPLADLDTAGLSMTLEL